MTPWILETYRKIESLSKQLESLQREHDKINTSFLRGLMRASALRGAAIFFLLFGTLLVLAALGFMIFGESRVLEELQPGDDAPILLTILKILELIVIGIGLTSVAISRLLERIRSKNLLLNNYKRLLESTIQITRTNLETSRKLFEETMSHAASSQPVVPAPPAQPVAENA